MSTRLPGNVDRVAVLWPALAFHVLATPAEARPLNLLQQVVLDLCRAGMPDVTAIADRLDMDRTLLTRVVRELQHAGQLTDAMSPAPQGATAVRERAPRLVYAFQSPFSGEVWPVAVDDLPAAPLTTDQGSEALPLLGHFARVREVPFPVDGQLRQPTAVEVLRALEGWRSREHDEEPLGRVWFIDEVPQRVHIACVLYLPKPPQDLGGWRALSPLGDEDLPFLRADVERAQQIQPEVPRIVGRLERAASERFLGPYRQYLAEVEDQAERHLRNRLGEAALQVLRPIRQSLLVMERDRRSAEVDDQRAATLRAASVTEAQKVLEHVAKRLLRSHPLPEALLQQIRRAVKDKDETLLREIVKDWNTRMPRLPHGIAVQSSREIIAAAKGKASLRACVLASVIAAHYAQQHPLHHLLAKHPDLLTLADDVATIRNTGAHEGAPPIPPDQVDHAVEATLRVVAALAPHLPRSEED